MTNQQHPITPPPELVQQWLGECMEKLGIESSVYIATRAAQYGADQELEACCEWLNGGGYAGTGTSLRDARRPKPPSLAEEALKRAAMLEELAISRGHDSDGILRLALERLQQLEDQQ